MSDKKKTLIIFNSAESMSNTIKAVKQLHGEGPFNDEENILDNGLAEAHYKVVNSVEDCNGIIEGSFDSARTIGFELPEEVQAVVDTFVKEA